MKKVVQCFCGRWFECVEDKLQHESKHAWVKKAWLNKRNSPKERLLDVLTRHFAKSDNPAAEIEKFSKRLQD